MLSNVNTKPGDQLLNSISRIAEAVLLLGGALAGLWLLAAIVLSLIK